MRDGSNYMGIKEKTVLYSGSVTSEWSCFIRDDEVLLRNAGQHSIDDLGGKIIDCGLIKNETLF